MSEKEKNQPQPTQSPNSDITIPPESTVRGSADDTVDPNRGGHPQETMGPKDATIAHPYGDQSSKETTAPSDGSQEANRDNTSTAEGVDATGDFQIDSQLTLQHSSKEKPKEPLGPAVPKQIGDYEIKKILGRGGMGIVYKAIHKTLGREVALKMVLAGVHASQDQLNRFMLEAKAVAHLQHPNIVQIFDVDEHDGLPYFSLEYVAGESLDRRLAGKPLATMEAATMMETIARAMQYAHDHGVLHRDLKPANVLLTPTGVPKITDFGLAKRIEDSEDSSSTRTGTIMGTPSYMSPEQASGQVRQMGPATDQYSLGAMLYEFLTGRPPFLAAKPIDTILQVLHEEPVPPRQLQTKLPVDLETICLKALQKEPSKRYASCLEFADDLARFSRGEPIRARPVGGPERLWRWCRRNPLVASLASIAGASIVIVAIVSAYSAVTVANKNSQLTTANAELLDLNRDLKLTNEELKLSNEEKQRRSERLQKYVQEVFIETNKLNIQESPRVRDFKNDMMTRSLPLIDQIRDELPAGSQAEATMMFALQKLGNSYADQDKTAEAEQTRSMLVDMARRRVVVQEGSDKSRQNLINTLSDLSSSRMELRRNLSESLQLLHEALQLAQDTVEHPRAAASGLGMSPAYMSKWIMANVHQKLGGLYFRIGNSKLALQHFDHAGQIYSEILPTLKDGTAFVDMPKSTNVMTNEQKKQEAATVESFLQTNRLARAAALYRIGNTEQAESLFRAEVERALAEVKSKGESVEVLRPAIGTLGNWGDFMAHTGREEQAVKGFKRAAELAETMLKINDESAALNRTASLAFYRFASWAPPEESKAATTYGEKALAIRRAMATAEPTNDRRQIALMVAASRFGDIAEAEGLASRFLKGESKDSEMLIEIAQALAQCSVRSSGTSATSLQVRALEALQGAIECGFCDRLILEKDRDLEPLRGLDGFRSILKSLD